MTRDPSKRFMGKPCRHGHSGERYVASGQCVKCRIAIDHKRRPHVVRPKKTLEQMRADLRKDIAEIMKS